MPGARYLSKEEWPDTSQLVTEDDEPVDNPFQERQCRVLVSSLYASWDQPQFLAFADVGVFQSINAPAIVPDVFVSVGVSPLVDAADPERHKAYFIWEYGKIPDLAIEIVSNKAGEEVGSKLQRYANIGVPYYLVYDPKRFLKSRQIRLFQLTGGHYIESLRTCKLPSLGLSFTTRQMIFEDYRGEYLRFTDLKGNVLLTSKEKIHSAKQVATGQRARADSERDRADRLAAKLREFGLSEADIDRE